MNVVFRVDASMVIGIGHVTRCLTLADTLRTRGIQCQFICREHTGHLLSLLNDARMSVAVLSAPVNSRAEVRDKYASWLGATQGEDAKQSVRALEGMRPDWIVVDHYALDVEWEQHLRPHAEQLMVIDDLADRVHDCDLLLDQNFSVRGEGRYSGLVPEHCNVLLGPSFALLRPEYRACKKASKASGRELKRVFVFFGGSDPSNLTKLALETLSQERWHKIGVDIVVGANYLYRQELERQAADRPGTIIHGPCRHLAKLLARADLAIGAGGVTTWERMCVGVPSIVVNVAENQRSTCEALAEKGLIRYLGDAGDVSVAALSAAIDDALMSSDTEFPQSDRCQLVVDGLGTSRIAEIIDQTEAQELTLRKACDDDVGLYYNWVNESQVRRNALNSDLILWPQHQAWFRARLADRKSELYVMEARSLPVGQIRFDLSDSEARIDYSIDPTYRGRGWGKRLVALGIDRMCDRGPVVFRAEVKANNLPSAAVFQKLGFSLSALEGNDDLSVFQFDSAVQTLSELQ